MTAWRHIRGDGQFELRFGGGINERDDFNVSPEEATEGFNFQLDPTGLTLIPRVPQDLEGTTPNAGEITGIMQLIERDDTVTQVVVSGDTWYDWDGASAFSDVTPPLFTSGSSGSRMRSSYWSLDEFLVITDIDLNNPLYKWDGTDAERLKTTLVQGSPSSVTSITCAGSTATVTQTTHGYTTGDLVTIAGANETEYNGEKQITVTGANTYTYEHTCGTTPATGTITADLGVDLRAKYSLVHNNRVWLFNVTADNTATPNLILVSAFDDAEDYDNATRAGDGGLAANDAFFLTTPDNRPINGAVEFFGIIILSTEEGKLFKLVGDDATNYAFDEYYPGSSVQGAEGLVNVGDDVVFFRRGREGESIRSTEKFGDVSTDDLSFWIPNIVKTISDPILAYDQEQQKIYFFDSSLEGVLVLDKNFLLSDRRSSAVQLGKRSGGAQLSPWTLYTTLMDNKFSTKCAVELRDPLSLTKAKTVFWGDDSGQIFNMNGNSAGDAGSFNINMRRQSKILTDLDTQNELMYGLVEYRRRARVDMELVFNWLDEYHRETVVIPLKPSFGIDAPFWGEPDKYWAGDIYWSAGRVVSDQISILAFSVPGRGSGFFLEIQVSDTGNYIVSRIVV